MNILYKDENSKYCCDCGKLIKIQADFCPHCGSKQMLVQSSGRNRLAAALFAFFLGGFGAHKFYLGKIWMGVIYLIFSWTFIPSIIAFIEGILLLIMSDSDFYKKYSN